MPVWGRWIRAGVQYGITMVGIGPRLFLPFVHSGFWKGFQEQVAEVYMCGGGTPGSGQSPASVS